MNSQSITTAYIPMIAPSLDVQVKTLKKVTERFDIPNQCVHCEW